MKIAVEGCAHGELEKIYETILFLEEKEGIKVDLLICCGDFQSTRNEEDLQCMAVPPKYRDMCSFYKYYSGEKTAPILTIFIGGNHEASNYLSELAYGGWVAPNIYYLGYAGVVQVAGVRIAGLSGIYKGRDYKLGHFEKAPFTGHSVRSVYHIRNLEIFRLKQLSGNIDIALSHDWPRGIYHHGNVQQLLRFKPFFQDDIKSNNLGSQPAEELLHHLKPSYWFSAHLHCKFSALVRHISYEDEGEEDIIRSTKFLALDKCLPKRRFLQVLDIPHNEDKEISLEYDLEWLTILSLTNHLLSVKETCNYMPGPGCDRRWIFTPTKEELDFTSKRLSGDLKVPLNFSPTVDAYNPSSTQAHGAKGPVAQLSPQTMAFCDLLGIDDPIALLLKAEGNTSFVHPASSAVCAIYPMNKGPIDDTEEEDKPARLDQTDPSPAVSKPTLQGMKLPSPKLSSGLNLPPPIHRKEIPQELETTSSQEQQSENRDGEDLEPSAQNPIVESRTPAAHDGGQSTDSQGPQMKRFKRRNQALYTATDDTE